MKNIEQILSMLNHVDKSHDWVEFAFFCSGSYCKFRFNEDTLIVELYIEYDYVGTITEEWDDDGSWYNKITIENHTYDDFFNETVTYDHKYVFVQEPEEVPDPT